MFYHLISSIGLRMLNFAISLHLFTTHNLYAHSVEENGSSIYPSKLLLSRHLMHYLLQKHLIAFLHFPKLFQALNNLLRALLLLHQHDLGALPFHCLLLRQCPSKQQMIVDKMLSFDTGRQPSHLLLLLPLQQLRSIYLVMVQ